MYPEPLCSSSPFAPICNPVPTPTKPFGPYNIAVGSVGPEPEVCTEPLGSDSRPEPRAMFQYGPFIEETSGDSNGWLGIGAERSGLRGRGMTFQIH